MSITRASRTVSIAGLSVLAIVGVTACGGEEFDPAAMAEQGIHDQILVELALDSDVSCADPPDTAVGTTFDCDATDEDGKLYHFVAEILEDEFIGTRLD